MHGGEWKDPAVFLACHSLVLKERQKGGKEKEGKKKKRGRKEEGEGKAASIGGRKEGRGKIPLNVLE